MMLSARPSTSVATYSASQAAPSSPCARWTSLRLAWVARGLVALGMVLLGFDASPVAAQPASSAQQFVEQRHDTAAQLLRRPAGEARNRELTRLFDEMLDFQELGRRSLGRHWEEHTEAERAQFVGLLQQLVQRAYQENLQRTLQFDVTVLGSDPQGDAFLVRTQAQSRSNRRSPPLHIDYSVRQAGGRWRVFDIHTDGVSMVANYRSQFNRIISRENWAALIARMQTRVNAGGSDL